MEMFIAPLPMVYISGSLFILPEYVLMLVTLTIETKFWSLKCKKKTIGIINFVRHILNSTEDIKESIYICSTESEAWLTTVQ